VPLFPLSGANGASTRPRPPRSLGITITGAQGLRRAPCGVADDLAENVAAADAASRCWAHRRASAGTRNGRAHPASRPAPGPRAVDVTAGAVVWATGFRPAYPSANRRRADCRGESSTARRDADPRTVRARPRLPVPAQLALHRRRRPRCRDDRRSDRRQPRPAAARRVAADRGGGTRRAPAPARGVARGREAPTSDRRPVRRDSGGPERPPGLQRLRVPRADVLVGAGRGALRRARHRRASAERRRRRRRARLRGARRRRGRPRVRLLRAARIQRTVARPGRP
jgi:hypothetical protein